MNKINGRNFETIYGNSENRMSIILHYHKILNDKDTSDISKEEARKAIIQIREMEKNVSEKETHSKLLVLAIILTYILTAILIMFLIYFLIRSFIMNFVFDDLNKALIGIFASLQGIWFTIIIGVYAKLNINIKRGGSND